MITKVIAHVKGEFYVVFIVCNNFIYTLFPQLHNPKAKTAAWDIHKRFVKNLYMTMKVTFITALYSELVNGKFTILIRIWHGDFILLCALDFVPEDFAVLRVISE